MSKKIFLSLIVFLLISLNLTAQNNQIWDDKPFWLKIDEAIEKVELKETGEAVYLFRKILEEYPENPESEMWLGLIFDRENEYDLALKHLELALEHKNQLVILEDQYRILYKMAEINYKQENYTAYTDNLNRVINYSREFVTNNNLKMVMIDVLQKRGYDKFIELYRPMSKISLKAYGLLGRYYFNTENWNLATEYLMIKTGAVISTAIEELKNIDPYFNFLIEQSTDRSLENIFDLVKNNKVLNVFFINNSFYESFYYLGRALKNSGYTESGSYILEKIYLRPESGKWGHLSNPVR